MNIPGQFEGPLRDVVSDAGITRLAGVDVSLLVAIVLAFVLYALALLLFPEPRAVFGPDGPRFVHVVTQKGRGFPAAVAAVMLPLSHQVRP